MLKSWKTSRQSREIQSEGWCLGAWCLHLPARERQTALKMQQLFASALSASGDLEAPVGWLNGHLCKLLACSRQKSCRTEATGWVQQAGHTWGEKAFLGLWGKFKDLAASKEKGCTGAGGSAIGSLALGPCGGRKISVLAISVLALGAISCPLVDHSQVSPAQRTRPQSCWQNMSSPKAVVLSLARESAWREWKQNFSTTSLDVLLAGSCPDPCLLGRGMERHGSPNTWRRLLTCGLTPELCVLWDMGAGLRHGHGRVLAHPELAAGLPKDASALMTPCWVSSKVLREKYFALCMHWSQAQFSYCFQWNLFWATKPWINTVLSLTSQEN